MATGAGACDSSLCGCRHSSESPAACSPWVGLPTSSRPRDLANYQAGLFEDGCTRNESAPHSRTALLSLPVSSSSGRPRCCHRRTNLDEETDTFPAKVHPERFVALPLSGVSWKSVHGTSYIPVDVVPEPSVLGSCAIHSSFLWTAAGIRRVESARQTLRFGPRRVWVSTGLSAKPRSGFCPLFPWPWWLAVVLEDWRRESERKRERCRSWTAGAASKSLCGRVKKKPIAIERTQWLAPLKSIVVKHHDHVNHNLWHFSPFVHFFSATATSCFGRTVLKARVSVQDSQECKRGQDIKMLLFLLLSLSLFLLCFFCYLLLLLFYYGSPPNQGSLQGIQVNHQLLLKWIHRKRERRSLRSSFQVATNIGIAGRDKRLTEVTTVYLRNTEASRPGDWNGPPSASVVCRSSLSVWT